MSEAEVTMVSYKFTDTLLLHKNYCICYHDIFITIVWKIDTVAIQMNSLLDTQKQCLYITYNFEIHYYIAQL